MKKKKIEVQNLKDKDSPIADWIKGKLTTTWGAIVLGFSLIGSGFAAGSYYANSQAAIKHNDDIMKLNKVFFDLEEKYEGTVYELRNKIYELQKDTTQQYGKKN